MTTFKPCPLCGGPLSEKDIRFFDDEGNEYRCASDKYVERIIISCDCGYSYAPDFYELWDELDDLVSGKWLKRFIEAANCRYKEGGQ